MRLPIESTHAESITELEEIISQEPGAAPASGAQRDPVSRETSGSRGCSR